MLTLNLSSEACMTSDELLNLFIELKLECQIIETKSCVKCGHGFRAEDGYIIKIFGDIDGDVFKQKVWSRLKEAMKIKCAFVRYKDEYMGCILNWPGVFTKTNCLETPLETP